MLDTLNFTHSENVIRYTFFHNYVFANASIFLMTSSQVVEEHYFSHLKPHFRETFNESNSRCQEKSTKLGT